MIPWNPERTWSVSELHASLNEVISQVYGRTIWVVGELRSLKRASGGNRYFDLVDTTIDGGREPHLSVTLFNDHRLKVNSTITRAGGALSMEDGTTVRICGELKTYPAQSRLQLVMTGIDPAHTLGVARQRRDVAMAALAADCLIEHNAGLTMPHPSMRVALVTSRGSAAEADVIKQLDDSGIGFAVTTIDARTQGDRAEVTLVAALRTAARLDVDVVVLVRGGGSRTDLQAFDSEAVGRAIAQMPMPVLTGIGHETDRSVADEVAHTACKTPTACAALLVEQAAGARRELHDAATAVATASSGRLLRAELRMAELSRSAAIACRGHLGREAAQVDNRLVRVHAAAPRVLRRAEEVLATRVAAVSAGADRALLAAGQRLERAASLVDAHDPARALARGWSITMRPDGAVIRSAGEVDAGDTLVTVLAHGSLTSTVEHTDTSSGSGG